MLGTHMSRDGSDARPSQATLAEETGYKERSVRQHLADAVDAGWLVLVSRGHRTGDGRSMASNYAASLPAGWCRLTPTSTGTGAPLETNLNRQESRSQPARNGTSTGTGVPPTKPFDHEKNKADAICPWCECPMDRPGWFEEDGKSVVCGHQVAS
jgi:hypothetical protein